MFKKIINLIENKIFAKITFSCFAVVILFAIMIFVCLVPQKEDSQKEEVKTSAEYVQIYYSNGEVYQFKAKLVSFGRDRVPTATLENGYICHFADMYTYEKISEADEIIWHIHLWRDEPYKLEKELFTKIE